MRRVSLKKKIKIYNLQEARLELYISTTRKPDHHAHHPS